MIYKAALKILKAFFRIVTVDQEMPARARNSPLLPETIDEAMDSLLGKMDLKAKVKLARMAEEDLIHLHPEIGDYIIENGYELVKGNFSLINSCRTAVGMEKLGEQDAYFLIIIKLWERLRKTHALRLIQYESMALVADRKV